MKPNLGGFKVAVVGGDDRELILIQELVAAGARVNVIGRPVKSGLSGVNVYQDPEKCLEGVYAVILPVPGIDERGIIYSPFAQQPLNINDLAPQIPDGACVFIGKAKPFLYQITSQKSLRLYELLKLDEVAILNSIPTAEGAVQLALEMMPITIHGCSAFVLGFGRIGVTLSRLLGAMGARTRVIARRYEHLARITEMNLVPIHFSQAADYLGEADVIFNTIPAPVLTGDVLKRVSPDAIIIDLASSPGGTDFKLSESLGIKAILAPGLPGKVAPKTAGRILTKVITRILAEETAGS